MTAREEDVKKWAREYDAFLEEEAKADHNAALLKGIRLGLEAAAREADIDWHDPQSRSQARLTVAHIRDLDPEAIAKEAAPPVRKDHRTDAAADAFYVEEADQ